MVSAPIPLEVGSDSGQRTVERSTALHSKVKGYFGALLDDMCVEALLFVGRELVGESGGRGKAREGAQKGQEGEQDQHGGEW